MGGHMFRRQNRIRVSHSGATRAITVVLILAASAVLTPLAGAAPEQKSYTAVVTPDPVGAGQTVAFTLTIVNTTKTQQIGSANLSAPSSPSSPGSFSLISATSP